MPFKTNEHPGVGVCLWAKGGRDQQLYKVMSYKDSTFPSQPSKHRATHPQLLGKFLIQTALT